MTHYVLILTLIAGIGVWPACARADIYKRVDKNGLISLTDHPQGPGYRLVIRTRKAWSPSRVGYHPGNRVRFRKAIDQAARRHGLNQALIDAVITAESGYDPDAISKAGAVGLMQLMPDTARAYGVDDPTDPYQNIDGGSRYLRYLLDQYQDVSLALAAYNAGETAVGRYRNRIPPFPETRRYVEKVMSLFRQILKTRSESES